MFPTVRVIVAFDLRRVVGLLNGAAYARAVLRHSMLGFERFSENSVMNAVIMAMTGQPGLAEVHQDIGAINSERRKIFTILVDAACEALKSGPAAFVNFLESLQAERDKNLHEVQKIFQTARNIDQNIAGRMQSAIRGCAMVQFGSTIILAATPLGLTFAGASTAVGAGVVGFGYSITKSLVKDMAEAKHARVIAFRSADDQ